MKSLGRKGMRATLRTKENQNTFQFFSKAIDLNNTYRLFLPVYKVPVYDETTDTWNVPTGCNLDDDFEPAVASKPGYRTDKDKVGTTFVPMAEYTENEYGQITDHGQLTKLSRISKLLYDAEYRRECERKEREIERDAADMGQPVDPVVLKDALHKIKVEYYGEQVNNTNVAPVKNRAIGSQVLAMFGCGVLYKMGANGMPEGEPATFTIEWTSSRSHKILDLTTKAMAERVEILKSGRPDFTHMLDKGYIEIEFIYNGTTKQEAGRNATFSYCGTDSDWTEKKFPKYWEANKSLILDRLLYNEDVIASKNGNLSKAPSEQKVRANFMQYCADNAILGKYFDFEGEDADLIKFAAKDMLEIKGFEKNPAFYQKLKDVVAESGEDVNDGSNVADYADEVRRKNEIDNVMKAKEEAGRTSLQDVLNNASPDLFAGADDDLGSL